MKKKWGIFFSGEIMMMVVTGRILGLAGPHRFDDQCFAIGINKVEVIDGMKNRADSLSFNNTI